MPTSSPAEAPGNGGAPPISKQRPPVDTSVWKAALRKHTERIESKIARFEERMQETTEELDSITNIHARVSFPSNRRQSRASVVNTSWDGEVMAWLGRRKSHLVGGVLVPANSAAANSTTVGAAPATNASHNVIDHQGAAPGELQADAIAPHDGSHVETTATAPHLDAAPETLIATAPPFWIGLRMLLFASRLNWLLLLAPFAIAAPHYFTSQSVVFLVSLIAILPLAGLTGSATEQVALHLSEVVGGILKAVFGNAVEVIISIIALNLGLFHVVQACMIGSIINNLLLVLGMSFLAAGIKFKRCEFSAIAAQTTSSLLLLAMFGIVTPTMYSVTTKDIRLPTSFNSDPNTAMLSISRWAASALLAVYMAFLYFQIKTHAHLFEDEQSACSDDHDEDTAEAPILSLHVAVITMVCFIALIVLMADSMMHSLVNVAHDWGISDIFVAVITLPIVGNAAEHSTAIEAALEGRINVSIGVAIGSSVQIACGVFPFLVILGAFIGQPLSFTFQTYEAFIILIIVMIVNAVVQDGESSWLEVRFGGVTCSVTTLLCSICRFDSRATFEIHCDSKRICSYPFVSTCGRDLFYSRATYWSESASSTDRFLILHANASRV